MQDLYFSLKFSPASPLNSFLSPISVSLDEIFYYNFLEQDVNVPEAFFDNGSYDIQFTDLFGFNSTTVVAHTSPGIPSPDNQSFINLIPEINRDFETPINLTVGEYTSLVFQEYSNLIGGLIAGNDTIRHPLNIIMDGGELCMHTVEIISTGKSSLIYKKGDISFGKETDCLQFKDGGALSIGKNAEMHYGVYGTGMLNLSSGAKIIMEEGAKLVFDGTLLLKETSENHLTNESKIDLVAGSQLTFSEHAKIISQNGNKKLNVYMNGGLLDLSNLDFESRQHLNLIYPEEKSNTDVIKIFPTISNGLIHISNNSDMDLQLEIISTNGKRITDISLDPWTIRQENISDFPNGIYFARFQIGKETYIQKIIRQ